jgi:hypothetical protein
MTDDEMWLRIWCRKVVSPDGYFHAYVPRPKADMDRMRRRMMKRYPGRFTVEQLRAAGMTRKGTRRKVEARRG